MTEKIVFSVTRSLTAEQIAAANLDLIAATKLEIAETIWWGAGHSQDTHRILWTEERDQHGRVMISGRLYDNETYERVTAAIARRDEVR